MSLVVLLVATSVSSTGFAAASYCHWDPATKQNVCVNEPYQLLNCPRLPAGQYSGYVARSSTSTSLPVSESESDYYCSCIEPFRQTGRGVMGVRTPSGCYVRGRVESDYYSSYSCCIESFRQAGRGVPGLRTPWGYYVGRSSDQTGGYVSYYLNCPNCPKYPSYSYYANYPYCWNYANNYPYCYCSDP